MIVFNQCTLADLDYLGAVPESMLDRDLSHAETMFVDGFPVAAGGVARVVGKTGEAWVIAEDEVWNRYPVALMRRLRKRLEEWIESGDFRRIQMLTVAGEPHTGKMAAALLFEFEGKMRRFLDDKDYELYARVVD